MAEEKPLKISNKGNNVLERKISEMQVLALLLNC
jgi:hypothetical protein